MATYASRNKGSTLLRNRIARAVFSAADSIGISDRELVEQLTGDSTPGANLSELSRDGGRRTGVTAEACRNSSYSEANSR